MGSRGVRGSNSSRSSSVKRDDNFILDCVSFSRTGLGTPILGLDPYTEVSV